MVTIAYLALGPDLPAPVGGTDARRAYWAPVSQLEGKQAALAFDHPAILAEALEQVRSKLEYTAVATAFCGEHLTLSELHTVYEVIWGQQLDPSNFRRKVLNTTGFVKPTGDQRFPPPAGRLPSTAAVTPGCSTRHCSAVPGTRCDPHPESDDARDRPRRTLFRCGIRGCPWGVGLSGGGLLDRGCIGGVVRAIAAHRRGEGVDRLPGQQPALLLLLPAPQHRPEHRRARVQCLHISWHDSVALDATSRVYYRSHEARRLGAN